MLPPGLGHVDLVVAGDGGVDEGVAFAFAEEGLFDEVEDGFVGAVGAEGGAQVEADRKSTRLNSSHYS